MDLLFFMLMNTAGEGDGGGDGGGAAAPEGGGGEPAAPAPASPAEPAAPAAAKAGEPAAPLKPVAARAAAVAKAKTPASSAASGTPTGTPPAAAAKPPVVTPPGVGGAPAAPVFTPKMTYKVKGQEKKFPEWITPAQIKDAAHEAQIRDIFEKGEGFDPVKVERDEARRLITEKYEPMAQSLNTASHFLKNGDLTSFFEVAEISEEAVIKWAIKRSNMDAGQKALDARQRGEAYNSFVSGTQQSVQQQDMQLQLAASRERELNLVISQPERAAFVTQFDARFGQPGRFVSEVIHRGQLYAAQGQDISVEQAVSEVLQLAGFAPGQGAAPAPVIPAAGPAAGAPPAAGPAATPPSVAAAGQPRARPPVIPNVQGSGGSPAKRVIKGRADLLAKRDELLAQGR